MKRESGKTARGAGLYTWEKAAGGAMPGALPEEATLNPTGPRLAWKQERAGISPGRRLFINRSSLASFVIINRFRLISYNFYRLKSDRRNISFYR